MGRTCPLAHLLCRGVPLGLTKTRCGQRHYTTAPAAKEDVGSCGDCCHEWPLDFEALEEQILEMTCPLPTARHAIATSSSASMRRLGSRRSPGSAATASATGSNSRKETNGCYKNHHRAPDHRRQCIRRFTPRALQRVRIGRDITVQAETSAEARRTVMDMVPNAVQTGVNRVEQPCLNPNFSHQPSCDYCNNACYP
jgi:hypothetical protein